MDASTKLGATPLHVAAEQGRFELVRLLLDAGAALDAQTDAGLSPLSFAAEQGGVDIARLLLDSGADVGACTHTGHTPLHIAAQKGGLDVMSVLLSHGGDTDARTGLGHTPLHLAALTGESDSSRLLLARGADADARNAQSGHTPLHVAAQMGRQQVAKLLLGFGGAHVDAKTLMGHTPLAVALEEGNDELARLLLSKGADASANDSRGITPLHVAAGRGASKMIAELLRRGAEVNARTSFGLSPLDLAVYRAPTAGGAPLAGGTLSADGSPGAGAKVLRLLDPLPAVEALLDGGAAVVTAHPWTGQTALHASAYLGREAWSELMLRRGGERAASDDARCHVHRGDGLEQRAQSTGRLAPATPQRLARLRGAASEAYRAAIRLAPSSATAYERLGAVEARLADSLGEHQVEFSPQPRSLSHTPTPHPRITQSLSHPPPHTRASQVRSLTAFEHAWRLRPEGGAGMAAFARAGVDMALAGIGAHEAAARPARTVSELSVRDAGAAGATRRALSLWRTQGVVVFPALLAPADVRALQSHARADGAEQEAPVDRTANIRSPANRTLRAIPVAHAAEALSALAARLDSFLGYALQSRRRLLLEIGLMRVLAGAADQGWHRDDGILDGRIASVQIALVDTAAEQGALEVLPASHTHTEKPDEGADGVAVAVPAGSVTVYTPNVVHRGRANALRETRLSLVLTVMGASGLVPNGIPLAVQPEDAGRWWLEGGELREVDPTGGEH